MKAHAILAALVLAAPAASFADHRGVFVASNRCYPRYYGGHAPYYRPYGWYAPLPFIGLTFASERPIYRASRYYEGNGTSLEADVQHALKRRGYYSGSVDGDIGPRSRAAIREFQADHGLPVTGHLDGPLLRSLGF